MWILDPVNPEYEDIIVPQTDRRFPVASVHCVVTSPPYWGVRRHDGLGDDRLGLEPTPEAYVEHIVECFREIRRLLRTDGTCWLNIGESYARGNKAARAV